MKKSEIIEKITKMIAKLMVEFDISQQKVLAEIYKLRDKKGESKI